MRIKITLLILVPVVAGLLLAGCSTGPTIPLSMRYVEPAAGGDVASLRGSESGKNIIIDAWTVYVLDIDGKRVLAGREGWRNPLRIRPGHHTISVEFEHGVFYAITKVDFDAVAGRDYSVLFSTDAHGITAAKNCDIWVSDLSENQAVSDIVRSPVYSTAGGGFFPIFVPVK